MTAYLRGEARPGRSGRETLLSRSAQWALPSGISCAGAGAARVRGTGGGGAVAV